MTEIKPGTPLPWMVYPDMAWVASVNAPDDAPVCKLCVESYGVNREPEAESNARYIVHTANAYPSLLNGLREAREALEAIVDALMDGDEYEAYAIAKNSGKDALAKLDTLLSQEGGQ